MTKPYTRWTTRKVQQLCALYVAGEPYKAIAEALGVPASNVASYAGYLGLTDSGGPFYKARMALRASEESAT